MAASGREPGPYVFLVLMVLISSSTATAAKVAVRELPIGLVPLVRYGGAGLCLLPLAWRAAEWRTMIRTSGARLLAAAACCVPINQTFFLTGTRLAPTTHVGMIYAACPLVVLALAVALGQERLLPERLEGVVACVLGVVVVGLSGLWHGDAGQADVLRGDLWLIGAVASWGAYLTVSKPLVMRHGALTALAGTFLVGSLMELPMSLALMSQGGWAEAHSASPAAWWGMAYLTLVVSVGGHACQNQALRSFDASQVAAAGNAAPLLTVLWGAWLLGEPVRPALLAGGALTIGGIIWAGRAGPGSGASPEAEASPPGDPPPHV